jgi:two-component system sensor kinase FixL
LLLLALVLVLCGGASAWMIWQGTETLAKLSAPAADTVPQPGAEANSLATEEFHGWIVRAAVVYGASGTACLMTFGASLVLWRRKTHSRLQASDQAWLAKTAALETQLADAQKSEAQLVGLQNEAQKQVTDLMRAKTQLQEELNNLKKSEKTLSQERQILESSKTVLELHVQARTKELQKLQRRYEHILNSAGEGICGLDLDGKITFVNPAVAKLTGWPLADLIGKPEQEVFGHDRAQGQQVHDGQQMGEQLFHRPDGSCFAVEFVRTSINEAGRVMGEVLVFKDITERKRVEDTLAQKAAELTRSNAELEQFAFVASHDLQEPLRKIQAFGDRLKTKFADIVTPEAKDYLERMQGAASRMRNLIDDLLAFSRAIRSTEPFSPVDLGVVTKEVLGDLEVLIEKNHAKVEVSNLPNIEADPMQMRQLLLNLIGNALKFQPAGGSPLIKISARLLDQPALGETGFFRLNPSTGEPGPLPGQLCELSIEDNGIGFDEQYSEKIFAVFQRLHGRNEYEGSGIGLAVCRRIADRHHGRIVARSQPGKGSNFVVTLPAQQPKPAATL